MKLVNSVSIEDLSFRVHVTSIRIWLVTHTCLVSEFHSFLDTKHLLPFTVSDKSVRLVDYREWTTIDHPDTIDTRDGTMPAGTAMRWQNYRKSKAELAHRGRYVPGQILHENRPSSKDNSKREQSLDATLGIRMTWGRLLTNDLVSVSQTLSWLLSTSSSTPAGVFSPYNGL